MANKDGTAAEWLESVATITKPLVSINTSPPFTSERLLHIANLLISDAATSSFTFDDTQSRLNASLPLRKRSLDDTKTDGCSENISHYIRGERAHDRTGDAQNLAGTIGLNDILQDAKSKAMMRNEARRFRLQTLRILLE